MLVLEARNRIFHLTNSVLVHLWSDFRVGENLTAFRTKYCPYYSQDSKPATPQRPSRASSLFGAWPPEGSQQWRDADLHGSPVEPQAAEKQPALSHSIPDC
jgi:hypothetical protein